MRGALRLARNDLRLVARDRMSFFWMLVFPLLLMWIFGGVSRGEGGPPKVSLIVEDRDGGWLARAVIAELREEPGLFVEEVAPGEEPAEGRRVRTLVVPESFTADVLAGNARELRLEKEAGANEEFSLAAQAAIVRVIARTLAGLTASDPTEREASFARFLAEPPAVALEVETAGRGTPVPTGVAQSVPGILTMTVLMMTVIYGAVFLTIERGTGMLRRQASLPLTRREVFVGKLFGRLLIAALQCVLLIAAGRFLFGLDFGKSMVGLVAMLACFSFATAGLATLLGAVLRTPEQASSVGWLASMVMAALGGCWWPSEIMPEWLRAAAHVFPTAWAMDGFHALISFGRGLEGVALPAAVLVGFGAVATLLGARSLRWQ